MKGAILISGYLRTLKQNLNNLLTKVLCEFDNVDVYIHLTQDETSNDRYFNNHQNNEDINLIREKLNPICIICEPNLKISSNHYENELINCWIKYYKLNQIKQCNEYINGKYDVVIKYRPDVHIFSDKLNIKNIKKEVVYIPKDSKIDNEKLKNKNDNYICDILAYGCSSIMDKYFSFYSHIISLTKEYGYVSETILFHYLNNFNIKYELINLDYGVILSSCNIFAICGDSGSGKTTLSNILKKYFNNSFLLECDRYHKWERHDKNWKIFTHLNPDANYLTKIQEDVFNLKLGKSIYQVNYNHITGKFTDKEKINPSNNIIVCGLHSLYGDNDQTYDFKIFMDTDEVLKTKWKIERDINDRGHDINQVIEQINERKDDFARFIYPQREKSDLIVNFHNNYHTNNISLKLFVNNKYNISNIIHELNQQSIQYTISTENEFIIFSFKDYQPIKSLKKYPITNDFYDYIIFFIFKLKKLNIT